MPAHVYPHNPKNFPARHPHDMRAKKKNARRNATGLRVKRENEVILLIS